MAKQWYELTFNPLQPLHIGLGNYGVVAPTRIFIPGKTMWGALTYVYGISHDKEAQDLTDEETSLFAGISNFYPVIDNEILFPNYRDREFCLGDKTERKFRYLYTDTFISTGISGADQSAADKSLHEIEYILPASKEKANKPLQWKGIINVDKTTVDDFLQAGLHVHVGGERKYGFGLIEMENQIPLEKPKMWNLSDDMTSFEFSDNKPIVHFVEDNNKIVQGISETWVETEKNDEKAISFHRRKRVYQPGCMATISNLKLWKGCLL
ncbi:MAG TPA: hypothetical protein DHW42_10535 [Candidatus Marinimicrobia bacterium]|nr:hypothetical protein [Candidatus Neomarinimicrobiota bacterium]